MILRNKLESNVFLGNSLIRMFATCGSLVEADLVFSNLPNWDVFTWTAIISAYAKGGQVEQAVQLFHHMIERDVKADGHIFVAALEACASGASPLHGKLVHGHVIRSGLESNKIIGNTLIDMHAKCGNIQDAAWVFDKSTKNSVVTWTVMIAGYAQYGFGREALQLFKQMEQVGVEANNVTYVNILKACSSIAAIHEVKIIHVHIAEMNLELDVFVCNSLMDIYIKSGDLRDACRMFDEMENRTVVTWNAIISGHLLYGYSLKGLKLFGEMKNEGVQPNDVTFITILKACFSIECCHEGKVIHSQIVKSGYELELVVSNTLIDMYTKCGSLEDACRVFNKMPIRDSVTWNTMIAGYTQHWHVENALKLFDQMQQKDIVPDAVSSVSILKACCSMAAVEQGKLIHAYIIENGIELNVMIGNSLIDMYVRCLSLKDARKMFYILPKRDLVTWNAMMAGYALHNSYEMALHCFNGMQQEDFKPNEVTFVSLLSACSHGGLVEQGCRQFKLMREDYGILPTLDHYTCMADLFGRAGFLNEADDLLQTMPFLHNPQGWTSLLSHCRTHGTIELGRRCFDHLMIMNGRDAAGHILVAAIYTETGMQEDAYGIEEIRNCTHAWKKPGQTFMEIGNQVHKFAVGDTNYLQNSDICLKLKHISWKLKEKGHMPFLDLVLQALSDDKDIILWTL